MRLNLTTLREQHSRRHPLGRKTIFLPSTRAFRIAPAIFSETATAGRILKTC
jgi:hypothetical protein